MNIHTYNTSGVLKTTAIGRTRPSEFLLNLVACDRVTFEDGHVPFFSGNKDVITPKRPPNCLETVANIHETRIKSLFVAYLSSDVVELEHIP